MPTKAPAKTRNVAIAKKSVAPAKKVTPKAVVKVPALKPAATSKAVKIAPVKAAKVVRDSFTMTAEDHDLLKGFKKEAAVSGRDSTKKSEVVRAALQQFATLSLTARLAAIHAVVPVKVGRPKHKK
jgi:hypothetical protein